MCLEGAFGKYHLWASEQCAKLKHGGDKVSLYYWQPELENMSLGLQTKLGEKQ